MNAIWRKRTRLLALLVATYWLVRWAFISQSEGLITPEESVPLLPLVLGAVTLTLRVFGLFVLLPLCVYWITLDLVRYLAKRRG